MSYIVLAEHNDQKDIEIIDPDGMQSQNQRYVQTQSSTDVSLVAPSQSNNVPSSHTSRMFPCTSTQYFLSLHKWLIFFISNKMFTPKIFLCISIF